MAASGAQFGECRGGTRAWSMMERQWFRRVDQRSEGFPLLTRGGLVRSLSLCAYRTTACRSITTG
jgi:hypothetical protein